MSTRDWKRGPAGVRVEGRAGIGFFCLGRFARGDFEFVFVFRGGTGINLLLNLNRV